MSLFSRPSPVWLCVGWLALAGAAMAEVPASYPQPDGKTLLLDAPADWIIDPAATAGGLNFVLSRPGVLKVVITPLRKQAATLRDVQQMVQLSAKLIAPASVEKQLPLYRLDGPQFNGVLIHATDPDPDPGDYRYSYQGAGILDGLMVSFSVFYNDGAGERAREALAVIRALQLATGS